MLQISYVSSSNYSMFVIAQKAINASEPPISTRHLSKHRMSSNACAANSSCPKCCFLQFVHMKSLINSNTNVKDSMDPDEMLQVPQ